MFKAKIKADKFKEVVDVISALVDEAKFNIKPDGISLRAVDPAHVAMLDLALQKKAFEEYKAKECELGVDIDKLRDVLKLAGPSDFFNIEHDEDKNRLILDVGNITRRMALVDTAGMSDPKVPNLNLPAKLVVDANELRRGLKAAEAVSDHVALIASPDGFEMLSEGDTDSVNLKLPKALLKELECKENQRSLFSLDYFSTMIKAIGSAPEVTMYLGTDYPINLEFNIAEGNGQVKYLLAPRIESE
ncbi:MAG: proliferating cell nuclear antigen (pcna) [Thermoplasmata archaeon]|nr:MAG: proliferating cell nuclear antigen (pcna) [Thermoplasmata archaeon]